MVELYSVMGNWPVAVSSNTPRAGPLFYSAILYLYTDCQSDLCCAQRKYAPIEI